MLDTKDDVAFDAAWEANFEAVQAAKREVVAAIGRKVEAVGNYVRASRVLALASRQGRPATFDEKRAFDAAEAAAAKAVRAVQAAQAAEEGAKEQFKAGVTAEQLEVARNDLRRA